MRTSRTPPWFRATVQCPSCTGTWACPPTWQLSPSGKGPKAKGSPSRLPICRSRSAASSGVARGRTPGSLKLVRSRVPITKKKRMPPTTGMAGVIFTARYGQLPTGWKGQEGKRGGGKERKYNVSNQQGTVCIFQEAERLIRGAKLISIKNSSMLSISIWGGPQFSLVDNRTLPFRPQ